MNLNIEYNFCNSETWPKNIHGIYAIFSRTSKKNYIGMTLKIGGFNSRWQNHRAQLKNNSHANNYLQNSFNKYGESDFYFKILEIYNKNTKKETIENSENKWIKRLKSMYFENGWNIDSYNEIKKKKSALHRPTNISRKRKFQLLDPSGKIINCKGINEFARQNNMSSGGIVNLLNGRMLSYKGFKSVNVNFHRKWPKCKLKSPDGKIIIFENISEFSRKYNLNPSTVSAVLRGKLKKTLGWTKP